MITCEAWILRDGDHLFEIATVDLDDLCPGEVLVEVTATGICHMDIEAKDIVPLPAVFGHEGVGRVVRTASDVSGFSVGDRVVMTYAACGVCSRCRHHAPYHCEDSWELTFSGRRANGTATVSKDGASISAAFFQQSSFARYAITPARGLALVDAALNIDDALLAALPCGVLTGAGVVAHQFGFSGGESIVVFGVGAVGLSAIMAARKLGAREIVAVDVSAGRLSLALELGATEVINAAETADVVARVMELFSGGVPYVLDTTGNASAFQSAMRSLATGGRMAYCILPAPMEDFQFKPFDLFKRAATLEAVSFGSAEAILFVPEMIRWYENGEFPVDRLVTTFPFSGLNDAVAASIAGDAIKPVLDMRVESERQKFREDD